MTDTRNTRWYLDIMSPNTKGEKFAWLDPTSIYINSDAFTQLLDDLTADLEGVDCDVVAGLYPLHAVSAYGLHGMYDFLTTQLPPALCASWRVPVAVQASTKKRAPSPFRTDVQIPYSSMCARTR